MYLICHVVIRFSRNTMYTVTRADILKVRACHVALSQKRTGHYQADALTVRGTAPLSRGFNSRTM